MKKINTSDKGCCNPRSLLSILVLGDNSQDDLRCPKHNYYPENTTNNTAQSYVCVKTNVSSDLSKRWKITDHIQNISGDLTFSKCVHLAQNPYQGGWTNPRKKCGGKAELWKLRWRSEIYRWRDRGLDCLTKWKVEFVILNSLTPPLSQTMTRKWDLSGGMDHLTKVWEVGMKAVKSRKEVLTPLYPSFGAFPHDMSPCGSPILHARVYFAGIVKIRVYSHSKPLFPTLLNKFIDNNVKTGRGLGLYTTKIWRCCGVPNGWEFDQNFCWKIMRLVVRSKQCRK